jgi:hypothetical protein
MSKLERWILVIVVTCINVEMFSFWDWQFYVVSLGMGIICPPLFKTKNDKD